MTGSQWLERSKPTSVPMLRRLMGQPSCPVPQNFPREILGRHLARVPFPGYSEEGLWMLLAQHFSGDEISKPTATLGAKTSEPLHAGTSLLPHLPKQGTLVTEHACVCVQARLPPRLSPLVGYHKIRLWTCDAQQALAAHPVHSAVRLLGPESSPSAWVSTPGLFPVSVNLGFSFQLCCVT